MKKIALLFVLITTSTFLVANSAQRELYIEQYKDLAISEMHRVGIPASIKLAQAILESNAGLSTLAREANNHFGIKCGSYWKGKTFYRKDDDRNKRGKLIKSCFRAFRDPVDSFMEHSDFLAVQNRKRYNFLFAYGTSDYSSWAFGLKKAGYATHKQYPQLLIKLIEEYQLYKYDRPGGFDQVVAVKEPIYHAPVPTNTAPKKKKNRQTSVFSGGSAGEISMDAFKTKIAIDKVNKVSVTYATEGDNIGTVAMRSGLSVKKLLKFNDGINSYQHKLESGTKVYLAKKKTSYKGKKRFHFVKETDSMVSLAQEYGIQVEALYKMNAMPINSEPAVGEKVRLKGKVAKGKKIKTRMLRIEHPEVMLVSNKVEPVQQEPIIELAESSIDNANDEVIEEQIEEIKTQNNPAVIIEWEEPSTQIETIPQKQFHIVRKGETLWKISKLNNVSVAIIRDLNELSSNTIYPGQKLRVK